MDDNRKLDEISAAIGEIRAYAHEHRHGIKNLSSKFDGLGLSIAKDIATMEAKMEARFALFEKRILKLEMAGAREDGSKSVVVWLFSNPVVAWLLAAALTAWTMIHGASTGNK